MKKIIKKIALCTFTLGASVLLMSTVSNAQVLSTQTGGSGKTVTILDTNGSGPGLTYNPSPSVFIAVSSINNAYAINAMNGSIANGDRNEYAVWSGNTGYYQRVNGDSAGSTVVIGDFTVDLTDTTDLTTSPYTGTGWVNMGGGGSGS